LLPEKIQVILKKRKPLQMQAPLYSKVAEVEASYPAHVEEELVSP